ncbi:MAG: hypothetical protein WC505_06075 [Patescibacteria group bacterium]
MPPKQVQKDFWHDQLSDFSTDGGLTGRDLITCLRELIDEAEAEGFTDQRVYVSTDPDYDTGSISLCCSRPETTAEQQAREAEEAKAAQEESQRLHQNVQMIRDQIADKVLKGLSQEEALALWQRAQRVNQW